MRLATLLVCLGIAVTGRAADEVKPIRALLVIGGCCHDYQAQQHILKDGISARAHVEVTISFDPDKGTRHLNPVYESADWAKGYDVVITTPREGVAAVIEPVAILKNAKNRELARRFVEYATSPAMQNLFAKNGTGVLPTHPDAAVDPGAVDIVRDAKLLPVDLDWVGRNRKRLVDQWVNEVIR